MNKKIIASSVAASLLLLSGIASADSVLHIWSCKLNEGMTGANAVEASSAWLAAAKSMPGGEDLEVFVDFPIAAHAGEDSFNFVLVAADEATWGAWYGASDPDNVMAGANSAWSEVASCQSSSMWFSVAVE